MTPPSDDPPHDDPSRLENGGDGDVPDDVAIDVADEPTSGAVESAVGDDGIAEPTPEPLVLTMSPGTPRSRPRIVVFGSGRGGTGRSLLAANVAVYLAQAGKKVVALDADPAGGPLHQLLGAPRPPRGFGELLRGKATGLGELIVDTPVAGVGLVGGEGSAFGTPRPKASAKVTLAAIAELAVDYVVIDLGPADAALTIDLFLAADVQILVTLPDPASIESTYRFLKSGFVRRLRTTRGLDRLIANPAGPPPAALDLFRTVKSNAGAAERLEQEIRRYRPAFVVNQTRTLPDLKLGGWMAAAGRRRLGHTLDYLGHVESDETVWLAARRHRSLVAEYPDAKASKNIERLGRRIISLESERERERPPSAPLRLEEEQTFYEVLETEPGVSDEEVRRAYRAMKEIYATGSLVVSGLYDEHDLTELHARVNAAHDTLYAPERRRLYDLALPEADLARAVRAAAQTGRRAPAASTVEERPDTTPEVTLDLTAEVTGAVLRKVRESRGIELGDIAQRSKISERYLRALEEEHFSEMPAIVYVRGYVMEYARALRLDAARVAESYLARYRKLTTLPAPTTAAT